MIKKDPHMEKGFLLDYRCKIDKPSKIQYNSKYYFKLNYFYNNKNLTLKNILNL